MKNPKKLESCLFCNKIFTFCMCTQRLQWCPTLCDPMDGSPPGSSLHWIFQAKYWSGFPFSSPGDLSNPGIKPTSLKSPAWAGGLPLAPPGKPLCILKSESEVVQLWPCVVVEVVQLFFATPWTVAYQAPPSMGFSRQENWSGLLFPSPGDLPNPGIKPGSPTLQADALPSEPPGSLCVSGDSN